MYDSVLFNIKLAERSSTIMQHLKLKEKSFYLATIHRAENTDSTERIEGILSAFSHIKKQIVLPMHPRIRNILRERPTKISRNIRVIDPVTYLDMLMLEKNAQLILTDSGGVQKEAYWFNVPCITLRNETEWIGLVNAGYNQVAGTDTSTILAAVVKAEENIDKQLTSNATQLYGDGHSAKKIVSILSERQKRFEVSSAWHK